jgi:cardiolipin synthase
LQKQNVAGMKIGIPNILSIIRILLIPVFIISYFILPPEKLYISAIVVAISGITDIADGIIARKCNMITPLGKILDPAADKMTQAAVCACLTIKHPQLFLLLIVFVLKELMMLIGGIIILKSGKRIESSRWFGKVATCVFFGAMLLIIMIQDISQPMLFMIIGIAGGFVVFAFLMYIPEFFKIKKS